MPSLPERARATAHPGWRPLLSVAAGVMHCRPPGRGPPAPAGRSRRLL